MKIKNILICILNLIEVIILTLLIETIFKYIHIYSLYMFILRIIWYIVGIINLIYGIMNVKKNLLVGACFILIGIITCALILFNHTQICDFDYEIIQIINYIVLAISGILSVVILILNRNLENDRKNKVLLAIFVLTTLLNIFIISFISIIHLSNVKNFKKYINAIQSEDSNPTYILDCINECIFFDENGQELSRKDYKYISTFLQFKISDKIINIIEVTTNDGKAILTNSNGEELFVINTGIPVDNTSFSILNLDNEESIFSKSSVLTEFLYYIANSNKYDFERANNKLFAGLEDIIVNYNTLNKYNESNKNFEDNSNYSYLYFKNNDFTNYSLQVAITNTSETDNNILDFYNTNCEYALSLDFTKMEKFYNYKKEFYLIDFTNNTKIKLDCNNLFYEARADNEKIVLLSNGYIPFYDKSENGYFNLEGKKVTIASNYLLYDVVDNNIVVIDKKTNETIILSSETGNITNKLNSPLTRYNGFYVAYFDDKEDIIIDNNFNIVASGFYTELIGDRFISLKDQNYNTHIYYYDGDNVTEVNVDSNSSPTSLISSNYAKSISSNVYSNIGIAAPESD